MFKFDYIIKEDTKEHPDDPWRLLIVGDSVFRKTNVLVNLISHQQDIDKIYLYAKNPFEAKYQLLIKKRSGASIKYFNGLEAFIEYWWYYDSMVFIKILKSTIQKKNKNVDSIWQLNCCYG